MQCKTVHGYWSGIYRQKKISPALQDSSLLLKVMIKLNTENSNNSTASLGGLARNTRLIPPNTTPTTDNKYSQPVDTKQPVDTNPNQQNLDILHNHLDWLTIAIEGLTENQFKELLNRMGRELITVEKGKSFSQGEKAKTYQNTIHSPIGLKGAYNSYQRENRLDNYYDLTISLSGQYFSFSSAIEQAKLCRELYYDYSATCSRADTSIDDYTFKVIPVSEMAKAYREDNNFDFRKYHHETDESDPNNPITVHYFGGEGSKRLVRVYNHKNKSLRLETQFRGKYAQAAFEAIATLKRDEETDEEWTRVIQKTIGGIAVGAIDFRDKSKLKNQKKACKSKTKRLVFWQEFIDMIGEPRLIKILAIESDISSHRAKFVWLEKYASKTIAMAYHLLGGERFIRYIYKLVRSGESKFTPRDRKKIEYLKGNLEQLNLD